MKEDLQMASVAPDPSPHLAAAFTILDPAGLATYLQGLYDLEAPVSCELLEGGVNDTYLVRTAAGSRVYRLYRLGWRNAAEVVWELALLDYLREQAAEVSAPLLDRTGAFQHVIHVPEGARTGALFTFAAGTSPAWSEPQNAQRFGESVAALHEAMDSFPDPGGRFQLDLDHLIDAPLRTVLPLMADRPEDAAYLEALGARVRQRLSTLATRGLSEGPCHGDLHGFNVHVEDDVWMHFDFDCGGRGWRAYDVSVFWWSMGLRKRDAAIWEAFLDGYGRDRLTPADHSALPWFVVARTIWLFGLHTGLRPRIGSAFMSGARYWGEILEFLRTWETNHLSEPDGEQHMPDQ